MRIAWVASGGFDESARDRVIPARLSLLERLARRHEVTVFVVNYLDAPGTYPLLGATVIDLGRTEALPGLRLAGMRRKLQRAVRERGPFDVFHGFRGVPDGLLAAAVAKRAGTPAVASFAGGELAGLPEIGYGLQRSRRGRRMVELASRLASRTTVGTCYMQSLAAARGIDAEVVPLGVDVSRFAPSPVRASQRPWRLVQVATLNRVKDQASLIRVLPQVIGHAGDVHLDLVGEDTLGGELQRLAQSLGIADRVTFHGWLPNDRLSEVLASAHLYVQSSLHEGASAAVLEAAASGLPIVGTSVGRLADWAPHAARVVPPGDQAALAAATVSVLHDEGERARLAAAARAWVMAHDVDWTAARMEELYGRLTVSIRAGADPGGVR